MLTTLVSFVATNKVYPLGAEPKGLLLEDDGNLLGVNSSGGLAGHGIIFRMSPDNTVTNLIDLHNETGSLPTSSLIQAADGTIYGTASEGANMNVEPFSNLTPTAK